MNDKYIKLETQAFESNISAIRLCLSTFLSNLNIHIDELVDIKTAISEAVTNAVDHAYDVLSYNNKIFVQCWIIDDEKVKIIVKDFGKGIEDITLAMTPAFTTKAEDEHAGMGFTIMETFMDEVIVDSKVDEGTTVTLTRKIRKKETNSSK